MAITTANSLAIIRSLIGETTAKFWNDTEIGLYQKMGLAKVQAQYGPWLFDKFKTWYAQGTVAGTADIDYPSGCYKISQIQEYATGRKLRYINEDEIYKYLDNDSVNAVWTHKGGKIHLLPTPSATASNVYLIWYMAAITDIGTLPDALAALVTVEAAILARTKNEDVSNDLMTLRQEYTQAVLVELATTNMHDINEMGDFTEEDSLL